MEGSDKAALLARIEFFKGCTQRQLDDIAKVVGDRQVAAGDVLCRQGEDGTDVFVFVEGKAAVLFDDQQVAELGEGEVVGELAMDRGGRRTATIKALTPLHVLVVDPLEVESVLASDPGSASSLGPKSLRQGS